MENLVKVAAKARWNSPIDNIFVKKALEKIREGV